MRQYLAVRQSVAVRAAVCTWQCARQFSVCGSASGSMQPCGSVRAAVCCSVRQCAAVCGSVRQCAAVCGSVRHCGGTAGVALLLVCPYRGGGTEPHISRIWIRTNRSIYTSYSYGLL